MCRQKVATIVSTGEGGRGVRALIPDPLSLDLNAPALRARWILVFHGIVFHENHDAKYQQH